MTMMETTQNIAAGAARHDPWVVNHVAEYQESGPFSGGGG